MENSRLGRSANLKPEIRFSDMENFPKWHRHHHGEHGKNENGSPELLLTVFVTAGFSKKVIDSYCVLC